MLMFVHNLGLVAFYQQYWEDVMSPRSRNILEGLW